MNLNDASKSSKNIHLDPEEGYVSIRDINNLFHELMRDFDKMVWPDRTMGSRSHVLTFIETIRHRLYKRAHANLEMVLPQQKARRVADLKAEAPSCKDDYDKHKSTIKSRST